MQTRKFTHVLAGVSLGIALAATAQRARVNEQSPEVQAAQARAEDRVVEDVDDARLVRLAGNVHPLARPELDMGRVDQNKVLERVVMVLKRSPQQEAALAAFNERQYDPSSPDFHHWLTAEEFGKLYGLSDGDIAAVSNWLQNHGMQINEVGKGRVYIQFTGTVGDVERAFHVEMHHYLAEGKMHLANDRDPQIPAALSPVVTGLASLHDFFPKHFSRPGNYVKRDLKTGKYTVMPPELGSGFAPLPLLPNGTQAEMPGSYATKAASSGVQPELGWVDPSTGYQREDLTPYDVATIYNILPLWNAATPINGTGVSVAIVGLSDVAAADLNTYRSSFGLPPTTLSTLHSGTDPGLTSSQGENTEDVEMVSATAPGAQIVLVADVDNATTNGLTTAILYIVNNAVAPILTMSYGECELKNGTAGNALFNQTFQQAATAGISSFVAAGDSGSATCTPQNGITPPYGDAYGLAVSGMASSPYVTAVGGTDLQWPFVAATHPVSTYWNTTADVHGATAKGYMPEMPWNATCTNPILLNVYTAYASPEALCNAAIVGLPPLVEVASGGGGVSNCTTNSSTPTSTTWDATSCSGGYAKPSWQSGVTGIPADGKRDLPDVSLFASYGFGQGDNTGIPGSTLLICMASASPQNSCNYSNPSYIIYQENGGTSAASPMAAGIMALVVQKVGSKQGLANPVLYSLASKENYAACNSNTVAAGNSCVFYDATTGTNAMNCLTGDKDCVTTTSGDQAGILSGYSATVGYDLATGLGSMNVANLVNSWPVTAAKAPVGVTGSAVDAVTKATTVTYGDNLLVTGWAADYQDGAPVKQVQVLIDGKVAGNAVLGIARPDVATAYKNPAWTNSGWTFTYLPTSLSIGSHTVTAVATDSLALTATLTNSKAFTIAARSPVGVTGAAVDAVSKTTTVVHGDNITVTGWAADYQDGAPVKQVQVLIDGKVAGNAVLGLARADVAKAYNNPAWTNSGWTFSYSSASLAVGTHTATAVATDSFALSTTLTNSRSFTVVAAPPLGVTGSAIDAVTKTSTVTRGDNLLVTGWAADYQDGAPVKQVQVLIDGTAVGNAVLGIARPDVATAYKNPAWTNSGWSFTYSSTGLATGTHTVTAVATDTAALSKTLTNAKTITVQ